MYLSFLFVFHQFRLYLVAIYFEPMAFQLKYSGHAVVAEISLTINTIGNIPWVNNLYLPSSLPQTQYDSHHHQSVSLTKQAQARSSVATEQLCCNYGYTISGCNHCNYVFRELGMFKCWLKCSLFLFLSLWLYISPSLSIYLSICLSINLSFLPSASFAFSIPI